MNNTAKVKYEVPIPFFQLFSRLASLINLGSTLSAQLGGVFPCLFWKKTVLNTIKYSYYDSQTIEYTKDL
jgi:hypothetical protein